MNVALQNLIEGPGQVRAVLRERLSRLRTMPECNFLDLSSIHTCLLKIGGYGGLDPVLAQSSLALLLQNDPQHLLFIARHMARPPEAA